MTKTNVPTRRITLKQKKNHDKRTAFQPFNIRQRLFYVFYSIHLSIAILRFFRC